MFTKALWFRKECEHGMDSGKVASPLFSAVRMSARLRTARSFSSLRTWAALRPFFLSQHANQAASTIKKQARRITQTLYSAWRDHFWDETPVMQMKPKQLLHIDPNLLPRLLAGAVVIAAILAFSSLIPEQTVVKATLPTDLAPGVLHTGLILASFLSGAALASAIILPALRNAHARETTLKQTQVELKALNDDLHRQASRDGLLDIANRREFERVLKLEWRRAARERQSLSLLMIDVDHFKVFNDTYGHLEGDRCLQEVSAVLNEAANRPGDLLARYGGEEMVILVPRTGQEGATVLAQRIHSLLAERGIAFHASPIADHITVSIGVASMLPIRNLNPHTLVQQADEGLYIAKDEGRNGTVSIPRLRLIPSPESEAKEGDVLQSHLGA
ncbi:GGDEF domain-containing protein [Billgrantia montanilacus]|uniref:GGDEF domain-containing protein n=1 Tax=Billgrantia montanilacus TaxID=2282305 RepID=UPI001C6A88E6|nr:diguanylate cyclase [Halomonas montanilacus]